MVQKELNPASVCWIADLLAVLVEPELLRVIVRHPFQALLRAVLQGFYL
ncbi:hypothetical protein [Snodgrassella gandavensis]|nr:hypothetical protein [Snodgrassella gandavensis]